MGRKALDLTGIKSGRLTVISRDVDYISPNGSKLSKWKCICECGNITSVYGSVLKYKKTLSCGCLTKEKVRQRQKKNLLGQTFGKLTVIAEDFNTKKRCTQWICQCKCGNQKSINSTCLLNGDTKSCGCYANEQASQRFWKGCNDISGKFFTILKNSAKIRNIEFNITIEEIWELFEKQHKKCAISGVDLIFPQGTKNRNKKTSTYIDGNASVDRINSYLGYNIDNIQLVDKNINLAKRLLSNNEFISLCVDVYNYQLNTDIRENNRIFIDKSKYKNLNWKGYWEISGALWNRLKNEPRKRNLSFDLTIEQIWNLFVKQNSKCNLSGRELFFSDNGNGNTASLDRIDSSKGYTIDNVQWVHKDINLAKRDLSDQEFIELCTKVTLYNKKD